MKLLIFIYSLSAGGAERVTANLANQWVRNGWQVTIVTIDNASDDFYRLETGVRRISLNLSRKSPNPLMAVVSNVRRIVSLRQTLRAEKPRVAVGMMSTASVLLGIACLGLSIATIGAERGHPSRTRLGPAWRWLRAIVYGRLQAMVAQTPEAAQWLKRHVGARNTVVIPNAVVWPVPDQEPRLNPCSVGGPGKKRLLAVGRLTVVKGMDSLLRAFALVAPDHPDWELLIIGDGPERRSLQMQIQASGLEGSVVLVGRVGNLSDWYRSAQVFVLTSRHEGFPNALLEAMAYGLTCVSFDCEAGPRNIIRHGLDGILVRDQDVRELAAMLARVMGDLNLRVRYGTHALEVRERFSAERVYQMWRDLITEVLDFNVGIEAG